MNVIKSEPGSKQIPLTDVPCKTPDKNVSPARRSDSRPPLKEKIANLRPVTKNSGTISEIKRQTISQFFQSTDQGTGRSPQENKLLIKTETSTMPSVEKSITAQASANKKTKNDLESDDSPVSKKLKVDKLQGKVLSIKADLPSTSPLEANSPKARNVEKPQTLPSPPSNPGSFQPVTSTLHEANAKTETREYYDEVFREVEDPEEKNACVKFAKMDLKTWIMTGQILQQEHQLILARLIEARMRLSEKFKVITDLINDRALALNAQGRILDQKLRKIQDLGKEILDII
ncbi:LANO_0H12266g1_1 [Lachancea nothofagi CBS 11611]|uniref:LANO_0H12266g1_1 n=1 Tax=Lachancea nothofagi CBS 11611 TaxID=1266666 RepID=A0A1G4KMM3_9SACH|nr:LANO_0H12266g1_1 [Lachancea nothofagi CBS 11611]